MAQIAHLGQRSSPRLSPASIGSPDRAATPNQAWQICNNRKDRAQVTMRNVRRRVIDFRVGSRLAELLVTRLGVASVSSVAPIDLHREMARVAATVEQALDVLLPPVEGAEARLAEAMRYATLGGGKRLRAFLVMESAKLFGVSETCAARVAASVEMLHAYSLIHDDLPAMDNDDMRRGKPSTHRAFDEATAILAGDALQCRAFEILGEPDTHSDSQVRCELVMALGAAAGARGMAGGQMIDMLAEGQTLDAPAVTRLQSLKTGRLIQYSAESGAVLGRVTAQQRHLLAAYGRDLGAAFQIADDLLDVEGDQTEIGKTAGKDAASGKATMVAVLGAELARAHADMLATQAADHLDGFGKRADNLRALAAFVVVRRS